MRILKTIVCLFSLILFLCSLTEGKLTRRIVSSKKREALLQSCELFTNEESIRHLKNVDFDKIENPFRFEVPTKQEVPQEEETVAVAEVSEGDPAVILKVIATSIKATGSIKRGDAYTLLFDEEFIHEGGVIAATYGGKEYLIYIEKIAEETYTLRLGDALLERNFEETISGHSKIEEPTS